MPVKNTVGAREISEEVAVMLPPWLVLNKPEIAQARINLPVTAATAPAVAAAAVSRLT
jgi:hypothetical protein